MSSSSALFSLKRDAKRLISAFRHGDPVAIQRIMKHAPRFSSVSPKRTFRLADALHVIAREQGFVSWPKLKAAFADTLAPLQETPLRAPFRLPPRGTWKHSDIVHAERVITTMAAHLDAVALAALFARLPLHVILSIRHHLIEAGCHTEVMDALLHGLAHPHAHVRHDCAHALDHLADDRCIPALRQLLGDPVPRVRRMALHVLCCDRCKAVPFPQSGDLATVVLHHAQHDPSINVRRHATTALGGFGEDVRVVGALRSMLAHETDPAVLREARRSLRRCQISK